MNDVSIEARWQGDLRFEAVGKAGIAATLDGDGKAGLTPVEGLAVSLATCMAADVVDILTRMRVPLEALTVRVEGDRRPDPPRRYTALRLAYATRGIPAEEREKLARAVDLSRQKYCSVLHTLNPDLDLSIRIESD